MISCVILLLLWVMLYVKGQGQGSRGSRLNITWVMVILKIIIFADGLTSMSSCFIIEWRLHHWVR